MSHRARAFSITVLFVFASPPLLRAGDWPGWRGPERTDVSTETGLLKEWPDGGPKQLWLFRNCGIGYSGPSVVAGKLYIMGARDGVEQLLALDAAKGAELWATPIGPMLENGWGDGPRGTPTVDSGRVYALGGRGVLICARADNGKLLWKTTMQDLGGSTPGWGYTESPLVDGNLVVCTPGGNRGAIAALDKATGKLVWQSKEFTDGAQYSSLIAADHDGARQYIQLTMKSVAGVAARDGKLLWRSDFPGATAVIPTPIFHDGQVYVTAGYGAGCLLIRVNAGRRPVEVYSNKVMKNHHGGVILVGDYLYGYSDGVGWLCQDFRSGKRVWAEKAALGKGAIACADGMLYCLAERDGTLVLIDASPEGWKEHGRWKLEPQTKRRSPQGHIWTHPVIADGRLYVRDQDMLFCLDVRGGN